VNGARHAVVTGASSGVGRALALALSTAGLRLTLVGRDVGRLSAVATEIQARGGLVETEPADLGVRAQLEALGTRLAGAHRALHLLVHSAGLFHSASVAASRPEDFDRTLDVNLRAPYVLTRHLLPRLVDGDSDVVMINSSAVGQRRPDLSAYLASKHGLLGMTESLRQELGDRQIRVLSVFLGATATPMQEAIHAESQRAYDPDLLLRPEDVAQAVLSALALPRGAEITDLHIRPSRPHR
jgi:NAD(P)-dependent dehydrogenase (short-subunit alcohol dehydrogenase family)